MLYPTILLTSDQPTPENLKEYVPFAGANPDPDLLWVTLLEDKASIGIGQIHTLISELGFKPFSHDRKAAVITMAHLLTLEAQNSLLKTLEEPPENTQIILCTSSPLKLLPTILSRVAVIGKINQSAVGEKQYSVLKGLSLSEGIKLSDEWSKEREAAKQKLRDLIKEIRDTYLDTPNQTLLEREKAAIACLERLERNVNAKLALDEFFFSFRR